MSSIEIITSHCKELGDASLPDEVIDYIASSFESSAENKEETVEYIRDMLCGFSPDKYGCLSDEEQLRFVNRLVDAMSLSHQEQETLKPVAPLSDPISACLNSIVKIEDSTTRSSSQENTPTAHEVEAVATLRDFTSVHLNDAFLLHLIRKHKSNLTSLADWLLERSNKELEEKQSIWEMEQKQQLQIADAEEHMEIKKKIVGKYYLEAVSLDNGKKTDSNKPFLIIKDDQQKKSRFRDGVVVSTKGQKYVVEKESEEWDGGSKGKVYTKGKRGKGFI